MWDCYWNVSTALLSAVSITITQSNFIIQTASVLKWLIRDFAVLLIVVYYAHAFCIPLASLCSGVIDSQSFCVPPFNSPYKHWHFKISTRESEQINSGGMSKILTLVCFRLSTEWYGVDIRPHCHAERVGATFWFFSSTKSSSSERGLLTLLSKDRQTLCTSTPIFTLACIRAEPHTCSNSYGAHGWWAHTTSASPGRTLPISLSHPTDADRASIYAPLHTGCQTCSFLIARREVFAALQRRCKTFVSRGVVPPGSISSAEIVAVLWEGELEMGPVCRECCWWSIPGDASFQLRYSFPLFLLLLPLLLDLFAASLLLSCSTLHSWTSS